MPYFKLLGGGDHRGVNGESFTKDSPAFFDERDLDEIFVNRFERAEAPKPKVIPATSPETEEEEEEGENSPKPKRKKVKKTFSSLGEDRSAEFPIAGENDLSVIGVEGGKFIVVEKEMPDKAVSPKLMKRKVVDWIESYLSE